MPDTRPPHQPMVKPAPIPPRRSWWGRLRSGQRAFIIGMGIIAVPIIYVAIVGAMAHHDNGNGGAPALGSTSSDSSSAGQSSLPANLHWVNYTDPSTGFKWALAVTKVSIATTPASSSAPAIPQGKADLTVDVAIKNLTNGNISVPMAWYIGLNSTDYDTCKLTINPPDETTAMGWNKVDGHPDYCWESAAFYDPNLDNTSIGLNGGEVHTGLIVDQGQSYDSATTQVNASTKTSGVLVGYEGNNGTILTLPQP